jgi:hypothetical protein
VPFIGRGADVGHLIEYLSQSLYCALPEWMSLMLYLLSKNALIRASPLIIKH